jgi:hypothetical protein
MAKYKKYKNSSGFYPVFLPKNSGCPSYTRKIYEVLQIWEETLAPGILRKKYRIKST